MPHPGGHGPRKDLRETDTQEEISDKQRRELERRGAAGDALVRGPARIKDGEIQAPPSRITVTGGTSVPNTEGIFPDERQGVKATPRDQPRTIGEQGATAVTGEGGGPGTGGGQRDISLPDVTVPTPNINVDVPGAGDVAGAVGGLAVGVLVLVFIAFAVIAGGKETGKRVAS